MNTTAPSIALPSLPAFGIDTANHASVRLRGYTAEQMHAYARAALQANPVAVPVGYVSPDTLRDLRVATNNNVRFDGLVWSVPYGQSVVPIYDTAPPASKAQADPVAVPFALRAFVEHCAGQSGGMVNGNNLAHAAREALDTAPPTAVSSCTERDYQPALKPTDEALPKGSAALEAIYDDFAAKDNGDVPLEQYPLGAIAALARAGWAVVPCDLPFSVLGDAAQAGVFETGNPKHGWDYLLARTRIGPSTALTPQATPKHVATGEAK